MGGGSTIGRFFTAARVCGLVLCGFIIASGCASRYDLATPSLLPMPNAQVWPPAPDKPRYAYVSTLIGEQNFLAEPLERGTLEKAALWIIGLVVGPPQFLELERPVTGVTAPDTSRLYVVDAGHKAVVVFDLPNMKVLKWSMATDNSGFSSPVGIVADEDGGVWVADADLAAVFHLDATGRPIGEFGRGHLRRPTGLAYDMITGHFFVADTAAHKVLVFDREGTLVDDFGCPGTQLGCFNKPTHLSFAEGRLYVADTFNFRVQSFDRSGDGAVSVGKLGVHLGNMSRPKGVAAGHDGRIYVVESYFDHLLIFSKDGSFLLPIGGTGRGVGEFYLPSGVWTDHTGRVFVADMFNGRVAIFKELTGE